MVGIYPKEMRSQRFITTLFICFLFGLNSHAVDVTIDNISYSLNQNDRTAAVTGSTLEDVVVPETITTNGMVYRVTSVASNAFNNNLTIKTFKCGNSIERISAGAFSYDKGYDYEKRPAKNLEYVWLGENCKEIGSDAFNGCSNLKKIYVGKSLEKIGYKAFRNTSLDYIVIPSSILEIYRISVFEGCPNLTIVCLKEGFDTHYTSQTIYPNSFFTFSGNNFNYSGVTPDVSYIFNGIGFGFQPTSVNMDGLSKDAGTHTDYIACTFANSDMSFDVKIPYTYTINKRSLTAKVLDTSRPYGDENPAFEVAYTGFVVGENETSFLSQGIFATSANVKSNVGTYTVNYSGIETKNYNVTYQPGTLTVTKAPLAAKPKDAERSYGASNPTLMIEYTGLKNNETEPAWITRPTIECQATVRSYAGTYPIKITAGEARNYDLKITDGTLTIHKADLTVTANNLDRLYYEDNPKLTCYYSGFVNGEDKSALTQEPTLSTTATKTSNADIYPITLSGGDAPNYRFKFISGALEVKKRRLTVSTDNYTRAYKEPNPTFVIRYAGFVNNENENVLQIKPTASTLATQDSDAGTYTINITGGAAANYDFAYNGGTLTIEKAYQTLTWNQSLEGVERYAQVELTATASSGLEVSYVLDNNNVCSIERIGNKVYLDCFGEGNVTIYAQQVGNHNYWPTTKIYKQISIGATGINNIPNEKALRIKRYATDGHVLSSPRKGINIIRMSDGTIKKVLVK